MEFCSFSDSAFKNSLSRKACFTSISTAVIIMTKMLPQRVRIFIKNARLREVPFSPIVMAGEFSITPSS